jgi:hypothetical protein
LSPAGDQKLSGHLDADAGTCEQLGGQLAHQYGDELVEGGDLIAEVEDAPRQGFQRDAGGADFDPRGDYVVRVAAGELTDAERAAAGPPPPAGSVDDIELPL